MAQDVEAGIDVLTGLNTARQMIYPVRAYFSPVLTGCYHTTTTCNIYFLYRKKLTQHQTLEGINNGFPQSGEDQGNPEKDRSTSILRRRLSLIMQLDELERRSTGR